MLMLIIGLICGCITGVLGASKYWNDLVSDSNKESAIAQKMCRDYIALVDKQNVTMAVWRARLLEAGIDLED
jgi:hypothetical protein